MFINYIKQNNRGFCKYYRNLATRNDLDKVTWLDFNNQNTWLDNWHLHFDWNGYGNNSFKRRKPHLDKLFRHFDILIEKTKNLKTDFQLYAILLDYNSSDDALFLHTPNPNANNFPFKFSDLSLESNLKNKELDKYIKELTGYKTLFGIAAENFCLLYKVEIGLPLV